MTPDILHRELPDRRVWLERLSLVTAIVDAMRRDPAWAEVGDIIRRRTAYRLAFAHWRWHEDKGWHDALRHRRGVGR